MINEEKISEYVAKSVESGVKPLELYFEPIYDCYYGELNSLRAGLKINSIISGTLKAEDYLNSGLSFGVMNELSLRAINKAVAAAEKLNDGGSDFKWLSVKCSSSLIKEKDLYKKLVEIKGGNFAHAAEIEGQATIGSNSENGGLSAKNGAYKQVSTPLNQESASSAQKVCVEFGAEVMKENAEKDIDLDNFNIDDIVDRPRIASVPKYNLNTENEKDSMNDDEEIDDPTMGDTFDFDIMDYSKSLQMYIKERNRVMTDMNYRKELLLRNKMLKEATKKSGGMLSEKNSEQAYDNSVQYCTCVYDGSAAFRANRCYAVHCTKYCQEPYGRCPRKA